MKMMEMLDRLRAGRRVYFKTSEGAVKAVAKIRERFPQFKLNISYGAWTLEPYVELVNV